MVDYFLEINNFLRLILMDDPASKNSEHCLHCRQSSALLQLFAQNIKFMNFNVKRINLKSIANIVISINRYYKQLQCSLI